jgi:hypothetical protein
MANVKVDIPGIGVVEAQNAASERTLKELLAAFKSRKDFDDKVFSNLKNKSDETADSFDDLGDSAEDASSNLSNVGVGLLNMMGKLVKDTAKFGGQVLYGADSLKGLGEAVPFLGDALGPLGGVLDNFRESFRASAGVGASFGNNVTNMIRASANAEMQLSDFADLVNNRSVDLAAFGGSVTEGVQRFGELSKQLRTGAIGERLFNMGFSVENVNEGLIEYAQEQRRLGRLQGMSQQDLIKGSQDYLIEIDRLAKITGMNRQEAMEARRAQLEEAKMYAIGASLQGEAASNFKNSLAVLSTAPAGVQTVIKDLADGSAQLAESREAIAFFGPEIQSLAQRFAAGELKPEEFRNELVALSKTNTERATALVGDNFALLDGLNASGSSFVSIMEDFIKLGGLTEKSTEAITKEQEERDKFTTELGSFEQDLATFRSEFNKTLLDSDVFPKLQDGLGSLFDETGQVATQMKNLATEGITKTATALDTFITSLNQGKSVTEAASDATEAATGKSFYDMLDFDLLGGSALIGLGALASATGIGAAAGVPMMAAGGALIGTDLGARAMGVDSSQAGIFDYVGSLFSDDDDAVASTNNTTRNTSNIPGGASQDPLVASLDRVNSNIELQNGILMQTSKLTKDQVRAIKSSRDLNVG